MSYTRSALLFMLKYTRTPDFHIVDTSASLSRTSTELVTMASASALPHHTPLVFRRAQPGDLTAIMDLISQARDLLRASDIPQWQGVHPTRADVMTDISRGWEYVLANDTTIAASAALTPVTIRAKASPITAVDAMDCTIALSTMDEAASTVRPG